MTANGKTFVNWSSGKDSALALQRLNSQGETAPELLITTIDKVGKRVPIHQIPVELLTEQMKATGLDHEVVKIPPNASNSVYESIMGEKLSDLNKRGYRAGAFGDIFLRDIRSYREKQYSGSGISPLFPLWNVDTHMLMREFTDLGFRAIVVAVDLSSLDISFLGREVDEDFLHDLPRDVDPAGENGEFHTFCYNGPCFAHPVGFSKTGESEKTLGSGEFKMKMGFCDLKPDV
jgi:uncharacterized protein (TIGR00290 family)